MGKKISKQKKLLFIWSMLLCCLSVQAQENKYMVFFLDKDTVTYTYDHPAAYLSERAMARREKFNIPVSFSDLPVNPTYLTKVTEAGGKVFYPTRWFNGALIACDETTLKKITSLDFVTSTELVRPNTKGGRKKDGASFPGFFSHRKNWNRQKELLNTLQNEMLGIDQMHQMGYTGKGLMIGVLDGGFRGADTVSFFQHLFKNHQIVPGYDFVGGSPDVYRYGQHGTEALSCIAAYMPDILEAGAYDAQIMLCVTEESGSEYRIEEYNWLFAAERADSVGVDIISTSLGYTTFDDTTMNYTFDNLDGKTAVITRAANVATDKGIVCVISAGNEGSGSWKYVSPPADAPDVLAVGAVSSNGSRVSFSSFGPTADGRIKPDVTALGLQTVVVDAGGNVTTSSGTSFSAPLIAGFVAGVWQAYPDLNNREIVAKIKNAGTQAMAPDNEMGYGIPEFGLLSENILTPVAKLQAQHYFDVFPNPVEKGKVFVEAKSGKFTGPLDLILYNSTGQQVTRKHVTHYRANAIDLDTDALGQGIYILQVLARDSSDTFKLVKF